MWWKVTLILVVLVALLGVWVVVEHYKLTLRVAAAEHKVAQALALCEAQGRDLRSAARLISRLSGAEA